MARNTKLKFVISSIIFGLAVSPHSDATERQLAPTLKQVESLEIGKTTRDGIKALWGSPYRIVAKERGLVVWFYLNKDSTAQKASFNFNEAGILRTKLYLVDDEEPESQVEAVFKHYPNSKFRRYEAEWINPHSAPDEIYYEDEKAGLLIEVHKTRNEVWSISWADPKSRKVAEKTEKQQYKKFQKENGLIGITFN